MDRYFAWLITDEKLFKSTENGEAPKIFEPTHPKLMILLMVLAVVISLAFASFAPKDLGWLLNFEKMQKDGYYWVDDVTEQMRARQWKGGNEHGR